MSDSSFQSKTSELEFHKAAHVKYFQSILKVMPSPYTSLDTSRLTALYFSVVGLDILGELDTLDKSNIIEYIYSFQLISESKDTQNSSGFIGGNFVNHTSCGLCATIPENNTQCNEESCSFLHRMHNDYHQGHIAMTYTALVSLLTLGDDLQRVNTKAIVTALKLLQMPDGAYRATLSESGEADVRFLYCACAISAILGDWTGVDKDAAVQYILQCLTYEGGIAVMPGGEATGGSCYCAVAALALMDRLDALGPQRSADLIRWCEARQVGGYQGRTNKDPDSCYSFWVGGCLSIMRRFDTTDIPSTQTFLLQDCQQNQYIGGFSKLPDCYADVLHSFYSIAWLSMAKYSGLKEIDPRLGVCTERSPLPQSSLSDKH